MQLVIIMEQRVLHKLALTMVLDQGVLQVKVVLVLLVMGLVVLYL